MENYQSSIFRCYLEKEPSKFLIPDRSGIVQAVKFLEPNIKGLECHLYPKENVLVVEGDNLWFCYMVFIGEENEKRISLPAHSISRKSIQVNYKQTSQDSRDTREYGSYTCERMQVTLLSHFSTPLRKVVDVTQV